MTAVKPLSANPKKWSKHTQIICRQFANEMSKCVFGHFVRLGIKWLNCKLLT